MNVKHIFVYQTICLINGKSYIGVHKTDNINDGYIGCGIFRQHDAKRNMIFHRAVRKYGYANFKRHILSFYDTYEEAMEEEKFIVNAKWINDKSNYNTALGGNGNTVSWMDDIRHKERIEKIKKGVAIWYENGGKEQLAKAREKAFIVNKQGLSSGRYGNHSPRRRIVLQLDKLGNVIKEHSNIHDAAKFVNSTPANVHSCCNGVYLSTMGFVFRYKQCSEKEKIRLEQNLVRKKREYCVNPVQLFTKEAREKSSYTRKANNLLRPKPQKPKKEVTYGRGRKLTIEHRKALSERNARYWLGKKRDTTEVLLRAAKVRGQKRTEEQRKKMSDAHKGKPSNNKRPILKYTLDGVFIKEYPSLTEAAKEIGCVRSAISNNLSGRIRTSGGFIFKYKTAKS